MINSKFESIDDLDGDIFQEIPSGENIYEKFLDLNFPSWYGFITKINNDNLEFFDSGKLKFSFRVNMDTGNFKHIDIYLKNKIRPYRRIFLKNNVVVKYRYYEFNSWKRNYDIVVGNNFTPIYTIEYFNENARYIDMHYRPGSLFYSKSKFLEHMYLEKNNEGISNDDN